MTPEDFNAIAGFAIVPMLLLDGEGLVLGVNKASCAELKLSATEINGKFLKDFIAATESEALEFLRNASRTRELYPRRFQLQTGGMDGDEYIFEGALLTPSDTPRQRQLILRLQRKMEIRKEFIALNRKIDELTAEIGRRKLLEQERLSLLEAEQKARRLAEHANKVKDEFLAAVSHELRTPMNAIKGWLELLTQGLVEEFEYPEVFRILNRNAELEVHLINDLLDVSRIITGKLALEIKAIELSSVLENTLDTVRSAVEAKQLDVQVSVDPTIGPIAGDADRLQQVAWNLLMNAIKFSNAGSTITVYLKRKGSKAAIAIEDRGVGIEPSFLPHVFERFLQEDGSYTRRHGGLGLGLAIVRHIVELHGGEVSAASEGKGKGATFTVILPLMAINIGSKAIDVAPGASGSIPQGDDPQAQNHCQLQGIVIAVVDDERDAREVIAAALRKHGAEVVLASSAREALDMLERVPIDVLVSDVEMPEESGYELIKTIREKDLRNGTRTRVAALTAHASTADRTEALSWGFDKHLAKPVDVNVLVKTIALMAERPDLPDLRSHPQSTSS